MTERYNGVPCLSLMARSLALLLGAHYRSTPATRLHVRCLNVMHMMGIDGEPTNPPARALRPVTALGLTAERYRTAIGLVSRLLALGALMLLSAHGFVVAQEADSHPAAIVQLDPAAWGDDHVSQPLPEYMTGDECLFCHRDIGSTWQENRHQRMIRPASPDDPAIQSLRSLADGDSLADVTSHLMGNSGVIRFLKRSDAYGRFEMLTTKFTQPTTEPDTEDRKTRSVAIRPEKAEWDREIFASRCAGCHTTAVDATTGAFSSVSLDCFVCHGDVALSHTKAPEKVLLSNVNQQPREVISTCGQCHLRGGRSKSSRRPYPNTFVAGDNLFRDYQVDLSDAAIAQLPVGEQHIFQNVRDVLILGQNQTTCLSCHAIHEQDSEKHISLANSAICSSCHASESSGELRPSYLRSQRRLAHNTTCEY